MNYYDSIKLEIYEAYDNGEISYNEKEYLLEEAEEIVGELPEGDSTQHPTELVDTRDNTSEETDDFDISKDIPELNDSNTDSSMNFDNMSEGANEILQKIKNTGVNLKNRPSTKASRLLKDLVNISYQQGKNKAENISKNAKTVVDTFDKNLGKNETRDRWIRRGLKAFDSVTGTAGSIMANPLNIPGSVPYIAGMANKYANSEDKDSAGRIIGDKAKEITKKTKNKAVEISKKIDTKAEQEREARFARDKEKREMNSHENNVKRYNNLMNNYNAYNEDVYEEIFGLFNKDKKTKKTDSTEDPAINKMKDNLEKMRKMSEHSKKINDRVTENLNSINNRLGVGGYNLK